MNVLVLLEFLFHGNHYIYNQNISFDNFIQIKIPKNLSEDEKNKLNEIKEIMLSKKDKPQSIFRKFISGM